MNLEQLTKPELISIIKSAQARLENAYAEAETEGRHFSGETQPNYPYSFGYLGSIVREVKSILNV